MAETGTECLACWLASLAKRPVAGSISLSAAIVLRSCAPRTAKASGLAVPTVSAGDRNVEVISFPGHLVATAGVENLLIIETHDATLICRRDRVQDVRAIVARLAADPKLAKYL